MPKNLLAPLLPLAATLLLTACLSSGGSSSGSSSQGDNTDASDSDNGGGIPVSGTPWLERMHYGNLTLDATPDRIKVYWPAQPGTEYRLHVTDDPAADLSQPGLYDFVLHEDAEPGVALEDVVIGDPVFVALEAGGELQAWSRTAPADPAVYLGTGFDPLPTLVADPDSSMLFAGGPIEMIGYASDGHLVLPIDSGDAPHSLINLTISHDEGWSPYVRATVPDGEGGWYIGGQFDRVNGEYRPNLFHVNVRGEVSDWTPAPDRRVHTLLRHDDILYVGGRFENIDGTARGRVAAFDDQRSLTSWNPMANSTVNALAAHGNRIFIGGEFNQMNGHSRNRVAAVSTDSAVQAWNPGLNGTVHALAMLDDVVYIGGEFDSVDGLDIEALAAVRVDGTILSNWTPNPGRYVFTIATGGNTIYFGGNFSDVGGEPREHVAAADTNGNLLAWNPGTDHNVRALALHDNRVYLGGHFKEVAGEERLYLAVVDTSGALLDWQPILEDRVLSLSSQNGQMFVGGYHSVHVTRQQTGVAALTPRGSFTEWARDLEWSYGNPVRDITTHEGTVYIAGRFVSADGSALYHLAAATLDGEGEWLTAFAPEISLGAHAFDGIDAIAAHDNVLYAGGKITQVDGETRSGFAAFNIDPSDADYGSLMPFSIDIGGGDIHDLLVHGDRIYLAGSFTSINGQTRNRLAALTPDGTLTAWNPNANDSVDHLLQYGEQIIALGEFTEVGGAPRFTTVAIDADSGNLTGWHAEVDWGTRTPQFSGAAILDDVLYVGGDFVEVSGTERTTVAGIRLDDSSLTDTVFPERPRAGAIAAMDGRLYVGTTRKIDIYEAAELED